MANLLTAKASRVPTGLLFGRYAISATHRDPYHLYVARLRQPPTKGRSLRLSRGRWPIEQYF